MRRLYSLKNLTLVLLAQSLLALTATAQSIQADPPPIDPPLPAYCPITRTTPGMLDSCYGYINFGLGVGPNGLVSAMATQRNGYLVAGGAFSTWDGLSRHGIARLRPDGASDRNFKVGSGFNGNVTDVAVLPSGKILAGGGFTQYQNLAARYLVRMDSTGAIDLTFSAADFSASLRQIKALADGRTMVLGNFALVNGRTWPQMARLHADGSLDTTFRINNTTAPVILSFDVQSDGKVVYCTSAATPNSFIARLNADGTEDATFIHIPSAGARLRVLEDNTILVLQQHDPALSVPGVMKLTPEGLPDAAFTPFLDVDPFDIDIDSAGKIYLTTKYTDTLSGITSGILKLNADGTRDSTFAEGAAPAGAIYISIGYPSLPHVYYYSYIREEYQDARLNPVNAIDLDGNRIEDFQSRPDYFDDVVTRFQRTYKNKILAIGPFLGIGQNPAPGVAILKTNGLADADFYIGNGFANTISQPSGNLMGVAGDQLYLFDTLGHTLSAATLPGTATMTDIFPIENGNALISGANGYMLRVRANGDVDTAFHSSSGACGGGLAADVKDAVSMPGGKILLAGALPKKLAIIDSTGFLDATFFINLPFPTGACSNERMKVLRQADGKFLVAGNFRIGAASSNTQLCRLLASGSLDTSFHTRPTGSGTAISAIAIMADGKIIVGGTGQPYAKLERLFPNGETDATFGLADDGIDGQVITMLPDGNGVIIGGDFTRVGGKPRSFAARVFTEGLVAVKPAVARASALLISPNPTTGKLRVETDQPAELLTLDGRSLQTVQAANHTALLDLSSLPKGLYLVRSAGKVVRVVKE